MILRAAAFVGERQVEIRDVPAPEIVAPDDVQVRVIRSGICGSDKRLYLGQGEKPGIHGHEAAGIVAAVGEGVTRLREGDAVVVYDVIGCGECAFCLRGQFTYCGQRKGGVSGGFGELLVAPERNLIRVPEGMSFDRACLMSDCFGTPAKAVRRVGVCAGETVAVFGCGPIGLNAVMAAKAYGARVIAVDPIQYRREAAEGLGADHAIDAESNELVQQIQEISGGGADKAMECSGSPEGGRQCIECLRPAGSAVFVGECGKLELSPSADLIRRDITVMGSWYMHLSDFPTNVRLCDTTGADPLRIVTHRAPLEDIESGFAAFCDRQEECLKAIVLMTEP
ncbi:MAG: zinc-binding dehydrogenase [Armatimonadota bacterium]